MTVTSPAIGAALGLAWLVVLAFTAYRYLHGNRSRHRFIAVVSMGAFWIAYSVLQIAGATSGIVEGGLVLLAAASFIAGAIASVRWWRLRGAEPA